MTKFAVRSRTFLATSSVTDFWDSEDTLEAFWKTEKEKILHMLKTANGSLRNHSF